MLTNTPDQTKNHVVLHVESPTKPYQDPCPLSVCHWCVWLGRGPLTIPYHQTLLAVCHNKTVLPIITGRGVKYTHNDINHTTVLTHSRGPDLCRIPEGRHQSLAVDQHPTR